MHTALKVALVMMLAWLPEYAWFDHQSHTATPGGKPGGGGLIGTGSTRSGGVRCDHCHVRPVAGPNGHIDAGVTFTPPLTAGKYAPGQAYTVNVQMFGEHRRSPMNVSEDGFAGNFELPDGGVAGALTSDTPGYASSPCVQTLGNLMGVAGTTITYRDCSYIINRAVQNNVSWTFTWTAPASNQGDVTFFYGVVDANGNDRTAKADAGDEDDVWMGKVVLQHP